MSKICQLITTIALATLSSSGFLFSCTSSGNKAERAETSDDSPDDYRNMIRKAIIEDDAASFAYMARYPIYREYPLHDIVDSLDMVRYFRILVDDSLKRVFERSSSDDWDGIGWRGTTLRDGSYLWCDEGEIYLIPYQSKKELEIRDSLCKADMSSLPEDLASGWLPESCLIDSLGTIYRIDKRAENIENTDPYRLLVYTKDQNRFKSHPSKILYGTLTYQGSAGIPEYTFTLQDSITWTYWFFWCENEHHLDIDAPHQPDKHIPLEKTYWLN